MIADTVIRAGEVVTTDIILYEPLPATLFTIVIQDTTVLIFANQTEAMANADSNDIVLTAIPISTGGGGETGEFIKVYLGSILVSKILAV